jgi:hypothetical protein
MCVRYDIWTVHRGPLWRRHLGGIMSAIGINPSTADDCRRYRWLITARNINKHLSNPPQLFSGRENNNRKYHSAARAHALIYGAPVQSSPLQEREKLTRRASHAAAAQQHTPFSASNDISAAA